MNRCPTCHQVYTDETLKFCRRDGTVLITDNLSADSANTLVLRPPAQSGPTQTKPTSNLSSIAVLPFVHMSADSDNEYFCDGLAEELLNALAQIEGLKVAARTSAFSFKGKNVDASEIGNTLHVQTVLEGSVRKSGNRLRITVQLINVADGYHLWSERYDREMKDIFDVQDEITLAVVKALKVKLLGEEKSALVQHHTNNPELYELYLKGRYYFNKYSPEAWLRAIEFFDQAIAKDPEYAPAYAGKARAIGIRSYYGIVAARKAIPECEAAINRALELDINLSEAHHTKANIHFFYEWDWAAADREYQLSLELNPNNTDARQLYALFLLRENFDQAISEGRRALELDPLSLIVNFNVGWIYWFAQRLNDTLAQVRKMLELEPNFFGAYWQLAATYWAQGKYEDAIEAYQKSISLNSNQMTLGSLGMLYGLVGKRDEAESVLNQLLEMKKRQNVNALNIARVYSGLNDSDKALEWLERAVEERNGELVYLALETKVGSTRGGAMGKGVADPRVSEVLQRAGLI